MEQLRDFIELLVHPRYGLIKESLKLLVLPLRDLHSSCHLEMQLFNDDCELLDLQLLALDFAILVLNQAVGDV